MAATATMIQRLRGMIAEPFGSSTYTDQALTDWIEAYPVIDASGNEPADDAWVSTYDLAACASELWAEKAAGVAADFTFSADGASYSRDQVYAQYMRQVRYYGSRRRAGTIKVASGAAVKLRTGELYADLSES